jgi:hypothetical protein
LPKFENDDGDSVLSSEATDMIVGEFAGAPVKEPALPAAAMIRRPLLSAACPALVYEGCGPVCAPSDIEMMGQRFAMAQFMPFNTLPPTLEPELLSTLPAKIDERKPTP